MEARDQGMVVRRSRLRRGQGGADLGALPAPARQVDAVIAFCDVKGDGVRSAGLATQWATLEGEEGTVRPK
jgi:hypothetical protein